MNSENSHLGDGQLRSFLGVFINEGEIRRFTIEALNKEEARTLAAHFGAAIEKEIEPVLPFVPAAAAGNQPIAVDQKTACAMLRISRTTLYRLLVRGKLPRIPGVGKVLIPLAAIRKFLDTAEAA